MQEAFGIVVFVVVLVGVVVAVLTFATSGREYDRIGRGGLSLDDEDDRPGGRLPTATGLATATPAGSETERREEIRQFLDARNRRRVARGEAPIDVDEEIEALLRPQADPGLEAEIRELVESRNARRVRRGEEPLDVDEEVGRRLRELDA